MTFNVLMLIAQVAIALSSQIDESTRFSNHARAHTQDALPPGKNPVYFENFGPRADLFYYIARSAGRASGAIGKHGDWLLWQRNQGAGQS